jgi:hypothetical protein
MKFETIMPVGSVRCHHMGEDYYERGLRLITAERKALRAAKLNPCDATLQAAWVTASRKLTAHENAHNTH